nr:biotin/lipoate A/B protein ligase family protein [Bifidobacterium simiarum]
MDLIADLGHAIVGDTDADGTGPGRPVPVDSDRLRADLLAAVGRHPHAELVGVTVGAIVDAVNRAVTDVRIQSRAESDPRASYVADAPSASFDQPDQSSSDQSDQPDRSDQINQSDRPDPIGQTVSVEPHDLPNDLPDDLSDDPSDDLADPRWRSLHPQIMIDTEPYAPAMQMALDQAIAEAVAAGLMPPTLRLWRWGGPAVVIGAYQSVSNEVDERAASEAGFAVVRRVTGGGAMFVRPADTITYSLYAPAGFVDGLDAAASYRLCDAWAFAALRSLGIPAVAQPLNDIAMPDGGKIGGAAQRRFPAPRGREQDRQAPGCVLHHVTMAYDIDAEGMVRILRISKEKLVDKAVTSAKKRVEPLRMNTSLSRDEVVEAMRRYALANIEGARAAVTDDLPESVIVRARTLASERFSNSEWTHRIG